MEEKTSEEMEECEVMDCSTGWHAGSTDMCDSCGTEFCYACRLGGTNPSEPYRDWIDDHSFCPACGHKNYWYPEDRKSRGLPV